MPWILITAFFAATVDRVYWAIWKERDMRIDPKGPWVGRPLSVWIQAFVSGAAGVAGAYAIGRGADSSDLFTAVVGSLIAGRLVGAIIDTAARTGQ